MARRTKAEIQKLLTVAVGEIGRLTEKVESQQEALRAVRQLAQVREHALSGLELRLGEAVDAAHEERASRERAEQALENARETLEKRRGVVNDQADRIVTLLEERDTLKGRIDYVNGLMVELKAAVAERLLGL
ncbi:hypothetical protein LCGC14_0983430 [marine sediment metagenome]|uniref:Uncharacterized protein n=1 Tax=marine sediment metagenome TaxID=412755 RepID=A0A0F9NCJ9_9ZZZZ